jgi:hypothetical protein
LNHFLGKIDSADLGATSVEVARDLSWPAPEIADATDAVDFFDEQVQHFTVEGFVAHLVAELGGVFCGDEVVA